jgi:Domain of unknown function (DUF1905)/Bacteriocin-protection, YdeI or OmpD-Associated
MSNNKIEFTAKIIQAKPNMDAAYVKIPFDVKATFGKLRVKVKATFNGVEYRGSIATMDKAVGPILGLRKDIRKEIEKNFGDEITVTLEEDTEPRIIEIPPDLQKELSKIPEANTIFNKLAYTHKKEYVIWINEAKKDKTRKPRILKTIEMI